MALFWNRAGDVGTSFLEREKRHGLGLLLERETRRRLGPLLEPVRYSV